MNGIGLYCLLSPLAVVVVAWAATWFFVGRKNAPSGSKANKVSPEENVKAG